MEETLKHILYELKAIRETQENHSKVLAGHTKSLAEHSKVLAGHTKSLAEHSKVLAGHTKSLAEHSKVLAGHTKSLADLKLATNGIMNESRQRHDALIENKDIRNQEIENLKVDVAEITGVIKGIRNSVRNFKKAE